MSFRHALAYALTSSPERRASIRSAAVAALQSKAFGLSDSTSLTSLLRAQGGAFSFLPYLQQGRLLAPQHRNRPLNPQWDSVRATQEFQTSVLVFRAIRAYCIAVGSVPWNVYRKRDPVLSPPRKSRNRRKPEDEWELVEGHPISDLLEAPNPQMSRGRLCTRTIQQHWLSGNGLIYIGDLTGELPGEQVLRGQLSPTIAPYASNVLSFPSGRPIAAPSAEDLLLEKGDLQLWPLGTAGFAPVPNERGEVEWYKYESAGVTALFPESRMIHLQFEDPANPFWGVSPIRAIARQLDMDREALEWNTSLLERGTAFSGGLRYKGGPLLGRDYEEARELLDRELSGVDHDLFVSGNDWEFEDYNRSPREMDFNSSRRNVREEGLSLFGMPPPVAGHFENATLANAEVSRKMWWLDAVLPYMDEFRTALEQKLIPLFAEEGEELWLKPDTSGVSALREDITAKIGNLQRLLEAGVPFNEAKSVVELDLDDIEGWGDIPFGLKLLAEGRSPSSSPGGARRPVGEDGDGGAATPDSGPDPVASPLGSDEPDGDDFWNVQPSRRPVQGAGYRVVLFKGPRSPQLKQQSLAFETVIPGIEDLTAEYEERIAGRVSDIIEEVRGTVDLGALATAIEVGASAKVLDLLGLDELEAGLKSLVDDFAEAAAEAGGAIVSELPVGSEFDLDRAEIAATRRIRELASDLVATNREGVLQALSAWKEGQLGDDPALAAQAFAAMPGLSGRQVGEVVALWSSLVKWNDEKQEYGNLTTAAKKAEKLAKGLADQRAELIGQVEAAGMVNGGQLEAWRQLERQGVVQDVRKMWVPSPGSPEICATCLSLEGQEVGIDERFHSDYTDEDYDQPTAHPNCYCGVLVTAELMVEESDLESEAS